MIGECCFGLEQRCYYIKVATTLPKRRREDQSLPEFEDLRKEIRLLPDLQQHGKKVKPGDYFLRHGLQENKKMFGMRWLHAAFFATSRIVCQRLLGVGPRSKVFIKYGPIYSRQQATDCANKDQNVYRVVMFWRHELREEWQTSFQWPIAEISSREKSAKQVGTRCNAQESTMCSE
jgi:hypothetical protein